jgi:dTDP-4-dehydrorhamnose reductase
VNVDKTIKLLIMGANGMLGHTILRFFACNRAYRVYGTIRDLTSKHLLQSKAPEAQLLSGVDVESLEDLTRLIAGVQPDIIINCIGVVKQVPEAHDPLKVIPVNALLPHRLAYLAKASNARLIHFSTDCVFSGRVGNYTETDVPDAEDLYGRSKLLGEVTDSNSVTLRTSIIGHELGDARSLIEWFLAQSNEVLGYKNAIFSGLPAVEIARVIHDFIVPNADLHGLYHLSVEPISKLDLLSLVAKIYGKAIAIKPEHRYIIDRSLNSERFQSETGFRPDKWEELVTRMRDFG